MDILCSTSDRYPHISYERELRENNNNIHIDGLLPQHTLTYMDLCTHGQLLLSDLCISIDNAAGISKALEIWITHRCLNYSDCLFDISRNTDLSLRVPVPICSSAL